MEKSINAIRFLGMDSINKANSGHPGIVLGAAPIIYSLYTKHMRVTPNKPLWFNRDRFVLAAGHATGMLYPTLHLAGFGVEIQDLKEFRQLNSLTPGHPEYLHTKGIDSTSGPLGQGIPMAAGMALAENYLAATFNKEGFNVVDHYSYVICGDGDLQEGVTQEAMSLIGHLGLEKLIVLYDSNDIQLDGPLEWANSENVKQKYESMNWDYSRVEDVNDLTELNNAIEAAKLTNKPSIIEVKSIIGFGSKDQGKSSTHGSPIGLEETALMRKRMNYDYPLFTAPEEVYDDFFKNTIQRGETALNEWDILFEDYKEEYPELAQKLENIINGKLDIDFDKVLETAPIGTNEASRVTGGKVLSKLSEELIELIGGSADLTKSTKAKGINGDFTKDNRLGRNINYGVREHAMAALVNGITLHGLKGFSGAFFVFADYLKPSVRMAAIMSLPSIYIFSHDSIAVGEDGPTHEPVEQLSMLRTTPNVNVLRPCDANETAFSYRFALEATSTPTVITLSRQNLEVKKVANYEDFKKGAYVISDIEDFEGILIATGSEVGLAIETQELLLKEGVKVRVVSMPSMDIFKYTSKEYQEEILPSKITKRIALEMGSPDLWYRYANTVVGIDRFGVSAPASIAIEYFGFTKENISRLYKEIKY